MKKFFLFATAVALTVGCQKQEISNVDPMDNGQPVPVAFGTSVSASVTTKAALEKVADLDGKKIYVFGVDQAATQLDGTATDSPYLLGSNTGGEEITFNSATLPYTTSKYYGKANYNFYGYYYGDATLGTIAAAGTEITIPVTVAGQDDILLAKTDKVKDVAASTDATVDFDKVYSAHSARRGVIPNLVFEHQLTQFTFKLENGSPLATDVKLRINDIKVKSYETADMVINTEDDEYEFSVTKTTAADGTPDMKEFSFPQQTVGTDKYVHEFTSTSPEGPAALDGSIMVMPGETSYKLDLYVAQSKVENGVVSATEFIDTVTTNLEIKLPDNSAFKPGYSYEVTVKVYAQEAVIVDVTLTDWKVGASISLDPDAPTTAVDNSTLYATLDEKSAGRMVYAVNVPETGFYHVKAALVTDKDATPADGEWIDLVDTKAVSTVQYAIFDTFLAETLYYCKLRYTETEAGAEYKYVESAAAVSPSFDVTEAYLVEDEATYTTNLPAEYTSANAWDPEKEDRLPWLVVECTPSLKAVINVKKGGSLIKTLEGTNWDNAAKAGLIIIDGAALGQEIVTSTYTVSVNGLAKDITVE